MAKSNQCCPYFCVYEAIYCSISNLPGAIPLKNSPINHQLSIAPQLAMRAYESLTSSHWNVDILGLLQVYYRHPQLVWVLKCSTSVMSRRYYFTLVLSDLWFFKYFYGHLSFCFSHLEEFVYYIVVTLMVKLFKDTFSQKDPSPMKAEKHTNVCIQRCIYRRKTD